MLCSCKFIDLYDGEVGRMRTWRGGWRLGLSVVCEQWGAENPRDGCDLWFVGWSVFVLCQWPQDFGHSGLF